MQNYGFVYPNRHTYEETSLHRISVSCSATFRFIYCHLGGFAPMFKHLIQFRNVSLVITRIHPLIHFVPCLTTGPQPLHKRVLYVVQSSASYFNLLYPLFSLKSSSSCLLLLHCLPVTSISLFLLLLLLLQALQLQSLNILNILKDFSICVSPGCSPSNYIFSWNLNQFWHNSPT
jgi:hypothetical protein